jgi:hypothetical protein
MVAAFSKKSGKGLSDRVVSELTTFFTIKPGHIEELRAACERFTSHLHEVDPLDHQKAGLRDWRHVIFDNDQRLMLMTTFESDWDPYIDDAITVLGADHFSDWLKHTVEAETHREELQETVSAAKLGIAKTAPLKAVLQLAQVPATTYYNTLGDLTMPEIRKAARLYQAFQQVLDDPAAAQALQHPALKPLLEQAAD